MTKKTIIIEQFLNILNEMSEIQKSFTLISAGVGAGVAGMSLGGGKAVASTVVTKGATGTAITKGATGTAMTKGATGTAMTKGAAVSTGISITLTTLVSGAFIGGLIGWGVGTLVEHLNNEHQRSKALEKLEKAFKERLEQLLNNWNNLIAEFQENNEFEIVKKLKLLRSSFNSGAISKEYFVNTVQKIIQQIFAEYNANTDLPVPS